MEKIIMAAGTALRISDTLKGGTTVVLLHGYLESLEIWGDFMKELAMHYRVLAIDIPGMGISQVRGEVHTMEFLADVLKGVLDKQGVERCFVVGHSMGGYVAEAFAAKYASMLQGLVLFHSTPNPDTEEKRENRRREIELVRARTTLSNVRRSFSMASGISGLCGSETVSRYFSSLCLLSNSMKFANAPSAKNILRLR